MSWERRNWGAVWRIKCWMPSCVQPAVAILKEKIEHVLKQMEEYDAFQHLQQSFDKGCFGFLWMRLWAYITELNRVQLMKGIFFQLEKSQGWKKEMKIGGCEVRTSSVWLRYPPPAKCARDPRTVLPALSARQPASRRRLRLITSQSCKNFAKIYQIRWSCLLVIVFAWLGIWRMEYFKFQIAQASQGRLAQVTSIGKVCSLARRPRLETAHSAWPGPGGLDLDRFLVSLRSLVVSSVGETESAGVTSSDKSSWNFKIVLHSACVGL